MLGPVQGGGAPQQMPPGMNNMMQNPSMAGIQASLRWKFLFFAGACVVMLSAFIAVFYFVVHFQWAPCSFMSELFLLVFGLIMMILDLPFPLPKAMMDIRSTIYKFLLFMTRFTGRGLWYLFLATMCFEALWDDEICGWLGVIVAGFLIILGGGAIYKGYTLSKKLDAVKQALVSQNKQPRDLFPGNHQQLSKDHFKALIENAMRTQPTPVMFSEEDLAYIINALAFTPRDEQVLGIEEFEYWLAPTGATGSGSNMLLV